MAAVVEIIGPPGVGKTTIYRGLCKKWNTNNNWVPSFRIIPINKNLKIGSVKYLIQFTRKLFGKPLTDKSNVDLAAYNFGSQYNEFASFCWDLINKNKIKDHLGNEDRFRSAHHLYSVFGNCKIIFDCKDERVAITDEFLTHRIIQITDESIEEKEIEEFVALLPKPKGIIYLDAPSDILAERLMSRKRLIIRHFSRNKSDLVAVSENDRKKFELTVNLLEKYGVEVLRINTAKSVDFNVNKMIDFLSKL